MPNSIVTTLCDSSSSLDARIDLLKQLLADGRAPSKQAISELFDSLANTSIAGTELAKKQKEVAAFIEQLQMGPLRMAVFVSLLGKTKVPRGEVTLEDGTIAFCIIADSELAATLKVGDRVLIDGKGIALLRLASERLVGEEAKLERTVGDSVEVSLQNSRHVMVASHALKEKLKAGTVKLGATVICNQRQGMVFDALPPQEGHSHFRFLANEPVPDVIVERDIGNPPRCIADIAFTVHTEMTKPAIRRKYGLRRTTMKLLSGVSGSGKTLAIQAIWRKLYEQMETLTKVPIEKLPKRVFRLKLSSVLSMWLGESDKNLDRFFDEVEQLAGEPFICPKGKSHTLPVLAILEEIDGLASQRGQSHESTHDRILTTALQRLDSTRPEMKEKLIVFIGTTNCAHSVDRAFLRRIGGTIEQFGRLDRSGFQAVLKKHVSKIPVVGIPDYLVIETTKDFFDKNGDDAPLLSLTYQDRTTDKKYKRDFLTGAVVDQSVQQAASTAALAEINGERCPGVHLDSLASAFHEQIGNIADQITTQNVHHYLDIPEGLRVADVRRMR